MGALHLGRQQPLRRDDRKPRLDDIAGQACSTLVGNSGAAARTRQVPAARHDHSQRNSNPADEPGRRSKVISSQGAAYELSRIIITEEAKKNPEKAAEIAGDIIDEAIKRELSASATASLITAKMAGPKGRNPAEVREIRFGDTKGQLKVSGDKSAIEPSFKGLSPDQFDLVTSAIDNSLDRPAIAD